MLSKVLAVFSRIIDKSVREVSGMLCFSPTPLSPQQNLK